MTLEERKTKLAWIEVALVQGLQDTRDLIADASEGKAFDADTRFSLKLRLERALRYCEELDP